MCGILFCLNYGLVESELTRRAQNALDHLAHRGPDDNGLWFRQPVVVGHRRLAILDLASSRQPMTDPSGRYVLSYNGEIYNFRELRQELERHWTFSTHGDTEVVLAGMVTQGESFLRRMEGMWAFALWDDHEKTLLLSRDRMGKKPLYYQLLREGIACASELPALAQMAGTSWEEDLDSTADYLRYGYYLPGTTAYQHVREVLPGHSFRWNPGRQPRELPYWSLNVGGFQGSPEEARAMLREKFTEAVRRRMVADVEVGAFLSGGIDSSMVVGIMSRELGLRPKTFTIGFNDITYDERKYATLAARHFGTDHHEELLAEWDEELLKTLILRHLGQPSADSSLLPTALVSRLAAKHVKVSLSGDGGDELFSGYQRYQGRALLRWYSRLPALLRRNLERLITSLPEPSQHHSRNLLKKAHLFLDMIKREEGEKPYVAPTFYSKPMLARLAPDLVNRGHAPPGLPPESRPDSILEMMAADALVYLPQDILVKVDRATMAYSLEARAPFLDSHLVQLCFSFPRTWHRRRGIGKRILRETFHDLLPRAVWRRRKQGFAVPVHRWFRGHRLDRELEQLLADTISPLSVPFVQELLQTHQSTNRDQGYRLWQLYVYLLWRHRSLTHAS